MSKYIELEEAKEAIVKAISKGRSPFNAIVMLHTADVRPVVLCKDCVHFVRGELFGDMVCDYHYLHHYHAEPNEFCSHAEKMEES